MTRANGWLVVLLGLVTAGVHAPALTIAENGKFKYTVVAGGTGAIDQMAVNELVAHLKTATGVEPPVLAADNPAAIAGKKLVVGDGPLARKLLGNDTVEHLQDQQALVRTCGDDLVLIGGGRYGTLYAVYSFLENEVGCRWYTAWGDSFTPSRPKLEVGTLDRREQPAFRFRYLSTYFYPLRPDKDLFFYRNRLNEGVSSNAAAGPGVQEYLPLLGPSCHSSFFYICPGGEVNPGFGGNPYPEARGFFKSHPEYFTMARDGKRVDTQQLCFSNPGLRRTLTQHLLDRIKFGGGRGMVDVSANDVPGIFCYCPECTALEKKYQSIGGPLYDYLIEACAAVAKVYPDACIQTLAYRKDQSEVPPAIAKLPDNLVIIFAPIDADFGQTLDHPSNRDTLNHLKQWVAIAKNVWVWYYTNPYNPESAPIGNIDKLAVDAKILRDIGVTGTFYEHGNGVPDRLNFAELQTWLLLKLFQNPDQAYRPLVREFTDYYYGAAAPLVRDYLEELETLRQGMTTALQWNPSVAMYTYLTPERLVKWQNLFDRMERDAAAQSLPLRQVKQLRLTLDLVTLDKWREVKVAWPTATTTPAALAERLRTQFQADMARFPIGDKAQRLNWLENLLKPKLLLASTEPKPIPPPLDKLPAAQLRQAFPLDKLQDDPDAALQQAKGGEVLELPLTMGVYDGYNRKWTYSATVPKEQIQSGGYHLYKVAAGAMLTPACCFWVSQQWVATVALEQYYVLGDPYKKWDVYASLKVEGPGYDPHSATAKNKIWCDRVILVEIPEK